jgi:predicted XRE-type DNA-binding protein
MAELDGHWTRRSPKDFLFRVAFDWATQIDKAIESACVNQSDVASRLGVSEGRVSQVLNTPGNLTLLKVVEYSLAVDHKVAIVAYQDGDPDNAQGPIDAAVFAECWHRCGRPRDFLSGRG